MKKHISSLLVSCIIFIVSLICYAHRGIFLTPFDSEYWKERYEQSQWQFPLSSRTIGDDGLFLYEGYLVSRGFDPTTHNPEVPPVGKYIIGASILLFRNGNIAGLFITTAAICSFFFLSLTLLKNKTISLFLTLLVMTDPLISDQFHLTMLDSIQLLFLLLTALCFTKRRLVFISLAGICLSLAAGTKAPVLIAPIIFSISLLYIVRRNPKALVIFLLSFGLFYILPYLQYFRLGHSFTEWVHIQKYMAGTYLSSKLQANYGSLFTTLFLNTSQNLFTKQWNSGTFFSPFWPFVTLGGLAGIYMRIRKQLRTVTIFIATLLISSFVIFSYLPFWTRYLVSFLPFLYLTCAAFLTPIVSSFKRHTLSVGTIIIVIQLSSSFPLLFPGPETIIKEVAYNIEHGFFHDIYEQLTYETKQQYSRKEFDHIGKSFYDGAQIEQVTTHILHGNQINIGYTTRFLGSLTSTATIPVVNEHGQWKIAWDWNYLHPDLSRDVQTVTAVDIAKRGTILQSSKKLAWDDESISVRIDPGRIPPELEKEIHEFVASQFGTIKAVHIHHRSVFDNLENRQKVIGTLPVPPDKKIFEKIHSYPGLSITPAFTRIESTFSGTLANTIFTECCSRLYSVSTYHGVSGYEKEFDTDLSGQNGGSITFVYPNGTRKEILKMEKRDGKDIRVWN